MTPTSDPSKASGDSITDAAVRWLLTGTFIVSFDFFAITVALVSIKSSLSATDTQLQWAVAAFGLLYGSGIIPGSRLGDRFGHRLVFKAGAALFAVASAGCAIAGSMEWFLACRAAQGLGAALLTPQVLTLVGRMPPGVQRDRAFAGYGVVLGVSAALGQLISGSLLALNPLGAQWRSTFVLVCIVALVVAVSLRGGSARTDRSERFDLASALLLVGSLALVMLPLVEGRRLGWPTLLLAPLVIGGTGLLLFISRQRALVWAHRPHLIDMRIFSVRRFALALLTVFVFYCGVASFFLTFGLNMQVGRGLSPLTSGLVFTIMAFGFVGVSFASKRLAARLGSQTLVVGSLLLAGGHLSLAAMSYLHGSILPWTPALLVTGVGMGMIMGPLIASASAAAPPSQAGTAAGLIGSAQWMGNAFGVALVGTIFFAVAGAAAQPASIARAATVSHAVFAAIAVGVAILLSSWLWHKADQPGAAVVP